MINLLMMLAAAGLYAYMGGWMVVAIASGVVAIAPFIELIIDFSEYVQLVAIGIALFLTLYDVWWHNVAGLAGASGLALTHYNHLLLIEVVLLALLLVRMVKVFNGQ